MIETETIIVGGGPAGAASAWTLRRAGRECIILDKESFPRRKLCGGWITPELVKDLQLDAGAYPYRFLTFERIHFHFPGFGFSLRSQQHSIRRWEFDHWLLERAGVPVYRHEVREIRRENGGYVIDGEYRARCLIGAGGTRCPVYRGLFREAHPHPRHLQIAALEQEFAYDYGDPDCHLWFLRKGLPGYAWYVPKADGYLNVGLGAMASRMKAAGQDIHRYWEDLTAELARRGLVSGCDYRPKGYSYFMRNPAQTVRLDNAYLVGDAAGLATWDLAEGIGPAVRSGILAAESILTGGPYSLDSVSRYTSHPMLGLLFQCLFIRRMSGQA